MAGEAWIFERVRASREVVGFEGEQGLSVEPYPFPWRFIGGRYSDLYLMSQIREDNVQADILALLEAYKVDAVAIDAGGRRHRGRMIKAAQAQGIDLSGMRASTGGEIPAGFSDLEATLAPTGRSLYIEVKAPAWIDEKRKVIRRAGIATQEQLQFLLGKHRRGALVLVAWSATDVEAICGAAIRANHGAL
jgi:hypothetical protein